MLSLQARYVEVSSFIVTHVVLVSHSVTQSVIESEPRRVISVPAEVLKIRGASKGNTNYVHKCQEFSLLIQIWNAKFVLAWSVN